MPSDRAMAQGGESDEGKDLCLVRVEGAAQRSRLEMQARRGMTKAKSEKVSALEMVLLMACILG